MKGAGECKRGQGTTQQIALKVIFNQHYLRAFWKADPPFPRGICQFDSSTGKEETTFEKALKRDF